MVKHSKSNQSRRQAVRSPKSGQGRNKAESSIRIVAGDWRGRKIEVTDADGLRPTGDRVRETLFNWLQLTIPGSRCLDLYAGSGALGLEAVSRGAASVTLVEASPPVARQLHLTLSNLGGSDRVSIYTGSAEHFLATAPAPFDVVFVDPPFDLKVHQPILEALTPDFLANDALLYVELPTLQSELAQNLPESLTLLKHQRFGDVTVLLLQFKEPNPAAAVVAH